MRIQPEVTALPRVADERFGHPASPFMFREAQVNHADEVIHQPGFGFAPCLRECLSRSPVIIARLRPRSTILLAPSLEQFPRLRERPPLPGVGALIELRQVAG